MIKIKSVENKDKSYRIVIKGGKTNYREQLAVLDAIIKDIKDDYGYDIQTILYSLAAYKRNKGDEHSE